MAFENLLFDFFKKYYNFRKISYPKIQLPMGGAQIGVVTGEGLVDIIIILQIGSLNLIKKQSFCYFNTQMCILFSFTIKINLTNVLSWSNFVNRRLCLCWVPSLCNTWFSPQHNLERK